MLRGMPPRSGIDLEHMRAELTRLIQQAQATHESLTALLARLPAAAGFTGDIDLTTATALHVNKGVITGYD